MPAKLDAWLSSNLPATPRLPLPARSDIDRIIASTCTRLLALQHPSAEDVAAQNQGQERAEPCEWSYSCAYSVCGAPPLAFRIGGTAIVGIALMSVPLVENDTARRQALRRAIDHIVELSTHPDISLEEFKGGFDVRNWAHCFGVRMLVAADRAGLVSNERRARVQLAIARYTEALLQTELAECGGWNYNRASGDALVGHSCTFLTAHCIVSLCDVRDGGYPISVRDVEASDLGSSDVLGAPTPASKRDRANERRILDGVIDRAFAAIERVRQPSGFLAYDSSGVGVIPNRQFVPECVGRLMVAEVASIRAGRVNLDRLRSSMQHFREAWKDLDRERGRGGVHEAPFGIAPYYFFFAFTAAAEAAHALPPAENDQEYTGSVAYGSAMAILALVDRLAPRTELLDAQSKPAPVRGLDRDER